MSKGTGLRAIGVVRFGKEPEVKQVGNATMLEGRVAATSGYGSREATSWLMLKVFGDKRVEVLSPRLQKGSRVFVDGEMVVREWNDRDGNKRQAPEIVVGFDGTIEMIDGLAGDRQQSQQQQQQQPNQSFNDDLDDDIPF